MGLSRAGLGALGKVKVHVNVKVKVNGLQAYHLGWARVALQAAF